jgi:hypothetical protein
VLVTHVEGVLEAGPGDAIARTKRQVVAEEGALLLFHDWATMTDYETVVRQQLVSVTAGLKAAGTLRGTHILVRSRVVALGVQGANVFLGVLTAYTDREAFEVVLREALAGR